jgi:DNA relaxase NicK
MYLKFVMMHGSYLTRLDIAVDCFNCGLRPQDATREIENGHIKTLARQFPLWHDAKSPGYTQYIGKKSSSAFCRIYDKAVEMGNIGDYTRVECSFGGTRAMDAGKKLLQGADYRALVRGFVDFGMWREWKEIMSVTAVPTKYVRTISKTQRWLLAAAAPSLARELYLAGDDDFYFRFIDTVRFHLDKLRQEIETDEEKQGEIA